MIKIHVPLTNAELRLQYCGSLNKRSLDLGNVEFLRRFNPQGFIGELQHIILNGIESHPKLELTADPHTADYIFFDYRHPEVLGPCKLLYPSKTVLLDYNDHPDHIYPHDFHMYFKRSVVDKKKLTLKKYSRDIQPLGFALKNEYVELPIIPLSERSIDVSVFFSTEFNLSGNYRTRVAQFLKERFKSSGYTVKIGTIGETGAAGRNLIQKEYVEQMLNSKLIITCNPDNWEGDWRLFEALGCGALTYVDQMIDPSPHPFLPDQHLLYYNRTNLEELYENINKSLGRLSDAQKIASRGHHHVLQHHTLKARMDEVLSKLGV